MCPARKRLWVAAFGRSLSGPGRTSMGTGSFHTRFCRQPGSAVYFCVPALHPPVLLVTSPVLLQARYQYLYCLPTFQSDCSFFQPWQTGLQNPVPVTKPSMPHCIELSNAYLAYLLISAHYILRASRRKVALLSGQGSRCANSVWRARRKGGMDALDSAVLLSAVASQ